MNKSGMLKPVFFILSFPKQLTLGYFSLQILKVGCPPLYFALTIRLWRPGDYPETTKELIIL
jgi:hypothetical protein